MSIGQNFWISGFFFDKLLPVGIFLLWHKLFSDKKITPWIVVHCAMVGVILFTPKIFFAYFYVYENPEYTAGLVAGLVWYVGLSLIMLGIIAAPNKLGYDAILKKEIWGKYYEDIGIQSQVDKNKDAH